MTNVQLVITLVNDEKLNFEEFFISLIAQLNSLKRRGKVSKRKVLKRNDLAKTAFRYGLAHLKTLNYEQFAEILKKCEAEVHTK